MPVQSKEVLIIDDDEDIRNFVQKVLEQEGMIVHPAINVPQAFMLAEQHVPHLVITDLKMPEEDGFSFLEKRRLSPSLSIVPVLVLSSLKDKDSIYRAASLGAADYLSKPISAAQLVRKVKKAVRDKSFPMVKFGETDRPRVTLRIPAEITKINEVGFMLSAALRVTANERIVVDSDVLEELGCATNNLKRTSQPSRPGTQGQYLNRVSFTGLSEEDVKRIRERIKAW